MSFLTRVSKAVAALSGPVSAPSGLKEIRGSDIEFGTVGTSRRVSWPEYRADQAIKNSYHKSFYLNTCVDVIVEAVAAVPIKVSEKSDQGTWEPSPDHALQYLLDRPNDNITRRMLMERTGGHMLLAGNSLWAKVRDSRGQLLELWPLNPDWVKVVPGTGGTFISHYEYGKGRNKKRLEAKDVVHFMRTNMETMYWGAGQIQVGQRLIDFDSASLDWNKIAIQNSGVIPGILGIKSKITDKQLNDLREKMKRKRVGMDEAGEDLILGSDVSYHRIGSNPNEMDWIESRKLTRQDIAMFMRVPLPVVSIYDDATLANIEQARKIFYLDRVIPFLASLEDAINLSITPEFGDPHSLKVEFDYSNIAAIQDNHFEKARTANVLVRIGFHPQAVNRRLAMGYNEDEIVDDFLVNTATAREVTSVGTNTGTRSAPGPAGIKAAMDEKARQNLHQWEGMIRGKINNELMRELDETLTVLKTEGVIEYQERYNDKWSALYLAAGEALSKYYIVDFPDQALQEAAREHALVRQHLLADLMGHNETTRDDAIDKLVTWLYNSWTGEHSETMAETIVNLATGGSDD